MGTNTPPQRLVAPPIMAQAKLDTQGRIQLRAAASPPKEKQTEPAKRAGNSTEKKTPMARVTTRGAMANPETLTGDVIRDLPGQEIGDMEAGKHYLEQTLLTIPGMPWTVGTLSTAVFQVTQYKGVLRQAVNVL